MELYIKLFEVLFPVFFIVGIGYFLGKKSPNIDTKFITNCREKASALYHPYSTTLTIKLVSSK